MTLSVGNIVAKLDEEGKPVTGEMAREFKVLTLAGYGKVQIVVLEEVK